MFWHPDRPDAKHSGRRRPSGPPVVPGLMPDADRDEEATFSLDIPVDAAMLALDACLSDLTRLDVAQAAKERGWASLHRELERHPVRPATVSLGSGPAKTPRRTGSPVLQTAGRGPARSLRLALSGAGALVVILAVVLGLWGAGLLSGGPGSLAGSTTTEIAFTSSTVPTTESTPASTETPGTTPTSESTPTSTETPGTTPTSGVTPTTQAPTTPTTGDSPVGPTTSTTKAPTTTTINPAVNVSQEKVRDAQVMAAELATAVVNYFAYDGGIDDVARHVSSSARASLTQMIGALDDPTSGQVLPGSAQAIDSDTVRFTLEFADTGGPVRFFVYVDVSDQGATITAISAAS